MPPSNPQGIEEIFVVKTEEIDFFGAMVRETEGTSGVNGRVWFRDGTRWYFKSLAGDRADLRKRLISLCKNMAALYGADIFHLKFNRVMDYREFIQRLQEAKQEMAYA